MTAGSAIRLVDLSEQFACNVSWQDVKELGSISSLKC